MVKIGSTQRFGRTGSAGTGMDKAHSMTSCITEGRVWFRDEHVVLYHTARSCHAGFVNMERRMFVCILEILVFLAGSRIFVVAMLDDKCFYNSPVNR